MNKQSPFTTHWGLFKLVWTIIQHTDAMGGGKIAPSSQGNRFLKGRIVSRVVQALALQDWVKAYNLCVCWLGYRGISKQ